MKRLSSSDFGIDMGDIQLFADYVNDGPMWAGSGDREIRQKITFGGEFKGPPAVQVSLSLLDTDQSANTRYEIIAENVTTKDFDVVFRTWSDSRIARVRASWIAFGGLPNLDDWDVD